MSAETTLNLLERSVQIILDNQHPSGAFLACPTMPDYQFSWFRDGAYIAYALTLDGAGGSVQHNGSMAAQWEAARRFHHWCAEQIVRRQEGLERAIDCVACGRELDRYDLLNARYHAEGHEGPSDWPEFQLDGPGTWLWSLHEFVKTIGLTPLPARWENAVILTARYLAALWRLPCYDCWEERGGEVHTSTLAAIYAGLNAAQALVPSLKYDDVCSQIKTYILENCLTPEGELAKSVGRNMVDANLISVLLPHRLLSVDDPIMVQTLRRIEHELSAPTGGVHRHLDDTYYGGGAWVLLALHLAWYYLAVGQPKKAVQILTWVESLADSDGFLPEQVNTAMLHPDGYTPWVEQRGTIANPLLWTHAMYIIVQHQLGKQ